MYKIYINDNPLYLMEDTEANAWEGGDAEFYPYMGRKKQLIHLIDQLEKSKNLPPVIVYSDDPEGLKRDYKSLYDKVTAAGGIVENEVGEVLFIYRRSHWDLPKGKMEPEEKKRECALREVGEETGLTDLTALEKVGKTRHTYRQEGTGERKLKITHWYRMLLTREQELKWQHEEEIETGKWIDVTAFFDGNYVTFTNIKDILSAYTLIRQKTD